MLDKDMRSIERERDWTPILFAVSIFAFHWLWGEGTPLKASTDQVILLFGFALVIRILGDIRYVLAKIYHKLP